MSIVLDPIFGMLIKTEDEDDDEMLHPAVPSLKVPFSFSRARPFSPLVAYDKRIHGYGRAIFFDAFNRVAAVGEPFNSKKCLQRLIGR